MRALIAVSGEPLVSPLRLTVDRSAPADQLLVPEEVEIEGNAHGVVEIVGLEDGRSETESSYQITLLPPPEGLPVGVAFAEAATTFRVTLHDGDQQSGCRPLRLSASGERVDSRGGFSTARITMEGPWNVALRFLEPYWSDRLEDWEEPPDLPIDLSAIPPVTLAIPNALSYRQLAAGGHRQQISLSWYDDLYLMAVAPGCEPVSLRCRRLSRQSARCAP